MIQKQMPSLTSLRLIAGGIALAMSALLSGYVVNYFWQDKYDKLQSSIDKERREATLQAALQANDLLKKQATISQLSQHIESEHANHIKQIDKTLADNRALLERVRNAQLQAASATKSASDTNTPAQHDGAAAGAGFWPALGEFAVNMAGDADSNTQKLIDCQAYVRELVEVVNAQ